MKTTELFVDQVLIGLLVLVTLLALSPLPFPSLDNFDLAKATAVVACAYFTGILYDRFADTLLQDMESHQRLAVSLGKWMAAKPANSDRFPGFPATARTEVFDAGTYRMAVIRNGQASDYSDYLRSRMRLTRALATLLPGMSVALVAYLSTDADTGKFNACGSVDGIVEPLRFLCGDTGQWAPVLVVTLIYGVTFLSQFAKPDVLGKQDQSASTPRWWAKPPRTELTKEQLQAYDAMLGQPDWRRSTGMSQFWAIWRVDPGLCLFSIVLTVLGVGLAYGLGPAHYAAVPLAGVLLTLLAAWTWWRISETFMKFIRRFARSEKRSKPAGSSYDKSTPKLARRAAAR